MSCKIRPDEDEECQPRVKRRKSSLSPAKAAGLEDAQYEPHQAADLSSQPAAPLHGMRGTLCADGVSEPTDAATMQPWQDTGAAVRRSSYMDRPTVACAPQPAEHSGGDGESFERQEQDALPPEHGSNASPLTTEGEVAQEARDGADEAASCAGTDVREPKQAIAGDVRVDMAADDMTTAQGLASAEAAPSMQPPMEQPSGCLSGSRVRDTKALPRGSAAARAASRHGTASKQSVRVITLRGSQHPSTGVQIAVLGRASRAATGHAAVARSHGTAAGSRAGKQQAQTTKAAAQMRRGTPSPAAGKDAHRRASGRQAATAGRMSAAFGARGSKV